MLTPDPFLHFATCRPDHVAMIDHATGRRYTYAQFNTRVGKVARLLHARGVKPGDRVSVLAMNSTDTAAVAYATFRLGAVFQPLNFRLTAPELTYIINDAEPKVLVCEHDFSGVLEQMRSDLSVEEIVMFDGAGGDSEFETEIASATPWTDAHECSLDDDCVIMYSSGTTGRPKGVRITHRMQTFTRLNYMATMTNISQEMVGLCALPMFHVGGFNGYVAISPFVGGTSLILRAFDPGTVIELLADEDVGITHLILVPAALAMMAQHPGAADFKAPTVVEAITGAEAVPIALVNLWREKGLDLQEVYGMTETNGLASLLRRDDFPEHVGTAGQATLYVDIRISREDGSECDTDEVGEIWFKGETVTPGYWRRPEVNAEVFSDGWLKSGDIGSMDEEGRVTISDRIKDMYISGGENVYPAEVESWLYAMDGVAQVAVIGIPDERWGETGCAYIVQSEGASLTAEAVIEHSIKSLAKYKVPSEVRFIDELPRNSTGKVQKFRLREAYAGS